MVLNKNENIGMTLQLIKSDGVSVEDCATVTYKILDSTATVEVVTEQTTLYNDSTQSYVDTLIINDSWASQEIGSYLIVWDISDTEDNFPNVLTEDLQITMDETKIDKILGLVHQNIYIDNTIYDVHGNLSDARVRIYSNSGSVGTTDDIIGTYTITSVGDGAGRFVNWRQIKV